jgi:hypothetical protein
MQEKLLFPFNAPTNKQAAIPTINTANFPRSAKAGAKCHQLKEKIEKSH